MQWEGNSDRLSLNIINVINESPEKVTKRAISATAHKVFDPLRILSPITLFPKLMLHSPWKSTLSWDQEVDSVTTSEFYKWMNDLNDLTGGKYLGVAL
ncbi:hypothetical protein X975_04857, partial [Stegodyphus mimosarum]